MNVILINHVHRGIFGLTVILLRLKKYKKDALRYVSLVNTSTGSHEGLLQIFHKSPLYIIRPRKIVELTYMISINKCPSYLRSLVVTGNVCNKTWRSANNMQIPRFNTVTYGKWLITYNALLLWKSLSEDMKTSDIVCFQAKC